MQSRTITFNLSEAFSSNFRLGLLATLFLGFMTFNTSQVSAQMTLEWEDINFAPSAESSGSSYFTQNNSPNVSISPNPVKDYARIQKEVDTHLIRLDVVDLQGNIRFTGNFDGTYLFIPQLEQGLYSFRIYTNKGVSIQLVSVLG